MKKLLKAVLWVTLVLWIISFGVCLIAWSGTSDFDTSNVDNMWGAGVFLSVILFTLNGFALGILYGEFA